MLDRVPLINPENRLKLFINSIIVTYNCFYLFIISIEVIFSVHFNIIYLQIATFAWITEMILQMNTATYHGDHFVTNRRKIIKIYLQEYFFFEILPLIFEGRSNKNTLLNVLLHLPLLLKIKGMMIILKKLEFYFLQLFENHSLL